MIYFLIGRDLPSLIENNTMSAEYSITYQEYLTRLFVLILKKNLLCKQTATSIKYQPFKLWSHKLFKHLKRSTNLPICLVLVLVLV